MGRILAILIGLAPKRWWKFGNFRQVGSHDLHFCSDSGGRRTIEWDGREIASGRRAWGVAGQYVLDIRERVTR